MTLSAFHPTLKAMDIRLTPDQKAFIRQAIGTGRFQREEDAVREALSLWEDRERKRWEFLGTLDGAAKFVPAPTSDRDVEARRGGGSQFDAGNNAPHLVRKTGEVDARLHF